MKWDNIKEYKRTLEYSYEPYNNQQLDHKPLIPHIPPIIEPKKTYNCFTVECDCSEKIVITEDTSAGKICKITLNYNYYTANDIFDIFKIPKIRSYNQVGHIIHLNLDDLHQEYKNIIGNVILSKTNAKTVIQKIKLNEIMRNVECEVLAGDENLETWHNENGFRFFIDYGNVYWNSKLANERNNLKLTGTVVDPFCGCGAFVLYALKNNCKVYCNDLNPVAIKCLEVNVKTYKKCYGTIDGDNVDCVGSNMDAGVFLNGIDFHVDHFLFNLPEYSLDYVKCLERFTGFILHCYFFAHDMQNAIDLCNEKCFMPVTKNNIKFIRKVSPSKDMYKLTIKRE